MSDGMPSRFVISLDRKELSLSIELFAIGTTSAEPNLSLRRLGPDAQGKCRAFPAASDVSLGHYAPWC